MNCIGKLKNLLYFVYLCIFSFSMYAFSEVSQSEGQKIGSILNSEQDLLKTKKLPSDNFQQDNMNAHKFNRSSPEILSILKRGVLRVGMCTIDQPPFHVMGRNGEFVGFDVDLSRELAEALGVKVVFVEAPDWEKTIDLMLDKKIDIILSNLTLLPERASKIYCSRPYAKIRQCMLINRVLLTRAGVKGLITLREIFTEYENRNLLIQEGTAYATSATSMFPKAHVEVIQSWEEIMKKILTREVFGTISDEIEIKKRMRAMQTMELMPVILKGKYDLMVIGVSGDSPHLLHFINSYLESNNIECNVEEF